MKKYFSLVKFSHTIFAMPFALTGFFIGYFENGQQVDLTKLALVVLCMIFARNAAMAFNRWLDQDIDYKNPRTAIREIPSGTIDSKSALIFVIINALAFIVTTYFINSLCFYLSPVALLIVLGYSFTKRFTAWCHLVLGLGLALAPIGAYIAVTGHFSFVSILLGMAVLFWVAGFDIIYALQDDEFDKAHHLNSIPVKVGRSNALHISEFFHFLTFVFITIVVYWSHAHLPNLGKLMIFGAMVFTGLLIYQHLIITPTNLKRVNLSFFTTNGIASLIFGTCFIVDLWL